MAGNADAHGSTAAARARSVLSGFTPSTLLRTACHETAQRACGAAGFVPRPVAVAGDFAVLCALAARRAGVALVPRLALPDPGTPGLSVHPLPVPVRRSVHAVHRTGTGGHPGTRAPATSSTASPHWHLTAGDGLRPAATAASSARTAAAVR
ncbi:LysR substrate-binding domain-containing protein [Streptomyces sp. NPDC005728]|uniref:LysR substrate-binding domain-containing protein n=1 Tax=Streptomyces sp. NPDC005728 TaxID=3157054 RepID=UPI0033F22D59